MQLENITLFSDASFCYQTHAAGGAYWARNHETKARGAFAIPDARKPHEAEVLATCRAILQLKNHLELGAALARGPQTRLIVVVDCHAVKVVLEGGSPPLDAAARRAVKRVRAYQQQAGFVLQVNQVKSHRGTETRRQWVNAWCDDEAGKHMRALRHTRFRKGVVVTLKPFRAAGSSRARASPRVAASN